MIIITGPGRSGTSFLANLYRRLRFDPGGGWQKDIRAGREAPDIVEVNIELCRELKVPLGPPPREPLGVQRWDLVPELAERYGPRLRALAERDVAKDPRFCWTMRVWAHAGARIDHVVATMRRAEQVAKSAQHAGMAKPKDQFGLDLMRSTTIYRMGCLLTGLGEYRVPSSVLWFPDYLSDPEGLYRSLVFPKKVRYSKFERALRKEVRPEFVNFGKDKAKADAAAPV